MQCANTESVFFFVKNGVQKLTIRKGAFQRPLPPQLQKIINAQTKKITLWHKFRTFFNSLQRKPWLSNWGGRTMQGFGFFRTNPNIKKRNSTTPHPAHVLKHYFIFVFPLGKPEPSPQSLVLRCLHKPLSHVHNKDIHHYISCV
jgi:hypothetical protein